MKLFGKDNYPRIKFLKIYIKYKIGSDYEIAGFLKKIIGEDDVFLDIGANLGQYALRLHRLNNGKITFYAFEPVMTNFSILKKYFSSRKNVIVENKSVSDYQGITDLFIPVIGDIRIDTQAFINPDDRPSRYDNYVKEKVEVIKIDDYIVQNNICRVDFIKTDTEGNDDRVIIGARQTISKYYPVILSEDVPEGMAAMILKENNYCDYFCTSTGYIIRRDKVTDNSTVNTDLVINIPEKRKERFINYII